MTRQDVTLLQSLVDYVDDVKPFHTKLKEITSAISFSDSFNANVIEAVQSTAIFQNIWTRDSLGSGGLTTISDGSEKNRRFRLPATVFSRFSMTDHVGTQTPVGDDPTVIDPTDSNADGIPDESMPWTGGRTDSHFTGADQVPVFVPVVNIDFEFTMLTVLSATSVELTFTTSSTVNAFWSTLYGHTDLHVYVNGVEYLGSKTLVGDNLVLSTPVTQVITITPADQAAFELIGLTDPKLQAVALLRKTYQLSVSYHQTSRYAVPYHQGIRVYVNGVLKSLGTDFTVDTTRSFIQFLSASRPGSTDAIDVNLMRSDRLLISYLNPFVYNFNRANNDLYDIALYDTGRFDRDYTDCFYVIVDSTQPRGYRVEFYNTQPGTRKGELTITDWEITNPVDGDFIEVKAISAWDFTVRFVSGTSGTQYKNLAFKTDYHLAATHGGTSVAATLRVDRVWANYYVDLGNGTFGFTDYIYPGVNPIISNEIVIEQDPDSYASLGKAGVDPTEFYPRLANITEHGVVVDPDTHHAPIRYTALGVIKQTLEQTQSGEHAYYEFVFDEVPARGTYIEFMVDQHTQFNPWVNATITERVAFTHLMLFEEFACTNSCAYRGQYYDGYDYEVYDTSISSLVPSDGSLYPEQPTAAGGLITEFSNTLTLNIQDSVPVVNNPHHVIALPAQKTNVMIVLDVSGSMNTSVMIGGTPMTRLAAAVQAINYLLDTYTGMGSTTVRVVTFYGVAAPHGDVWESVTSAKAYLNTLVATGSGTNYDAALATAITAFDGVGKLTDAQNILYFLTDGAPNHSSGDVNTLYGELLQAMSSPDSGIQIGEEIQWINFLKANKVTAHVFSIAGGVGSGNIDPIAYDGLTDIDLNGVEVVDLNQLSLYLQSTVGAPVSGNLLGGPIEVTGTTIGADGGYVLSVTIDTATGAPRSYSNVLDFEAVNLGGVQFLQNIPATSLGNGTWHTDNSGGYVEIGYEGLYKGTSSTNKVIELERLPGDASNLYVDIDAVVGDIYNLVFDYAATYHDNVNFLYSSGITVYWDTQIVAVLDTQTLAWTHYDLDLAAARTGMIRLEFRANETSNNGGILDNIAVNLVSTTTSHEVITYTYDKTFGTMTTSNASIPDFTGGVLSVHTVNHGMFTITMLTGAYTYTAPTLLQYSAPFNEIITVTLVDNDNDTATGDLVLEVQRTVATSGYVAAVVPVAPGVGTATGNSVDLSESALPGGIPASGDLHPQVSLVSGNLVIGEKDRVKKINPPLGSYTSGGQPVVWVNTPTDLDIVGYVGSVAAGNEVVMVNLTSAGHYVIRLLKPLDHVSGVGRNVTNIPLVVDWISELVLNDLRLFEPGCPVRAPGPFDTDDYDWAPIYPTILDDMYMSVTYQDTLETRVRHHVALHPDANFYQEPALVNDLVLHSPNGATSVIVYHLGLEIIPDNVTINGPMISISMTTARSIAVEILR